MTDAPTQTPQIKHLSQLYIRLAAAALLIAIAIVARITLRLPKQVNSPPPSSNVVNGVALPPGVLASPAERLAKIDNGLYPVPDGANLCCWLAPDATIGAEQPAGSKFIIVNLFLPRFRFFERGGQTVTLVVKGRSTRVKILEPGTSIIRLPLMSPSWGPRRLKVQLLSSRVFVPANEHINADTRSLGVVLRGVYFE